MAHRVFSPLILGQEKTSWNCAISNPLPHILLKYNPGFRFYYFRLRLLKKVSSTSNMFITFIQNSTLKWPQYHLKPNVWLSLGVETVSSDKRNQMSFRDLRSLLVTGVMERYNKVFTYSSPPPLFYQLLYFNLPPCWFPCWETWNVFSFCFSD